MLEYGIKEVTTNPTLITKATEIIKLVDSRNHQARAFVLPVSYEPFISELLKKIEFKNWIEKKKKLIQKGQKDNLDDIMEKGIESISSYLDTHR